MCVGRMMNVLFIIQSKKILDIRKNILEKRNQRLMILRILLDMFKC